MEETVTDFLTEKHFAVKIPLPLYVPHKKLVRCLKYWETIFFHLYNVGQNFEGKTYPPPYFVGWNKDNSWDDLHFNIDIQASENLLGATRESSGAKHAESYSGGVDSVPWEPEPGAATAV